MIDTFAEAAKSHPTSKRLQYSRVQYTTQQNGLQILEQETREKDISALLSFLYGGGTHVLRYVKRVLFSS